MQSFSLIYLLKLRIMMMMMSQIINAGITLTKVRVK